MKTLGLVCRLSLILSFYSVLSTTSCSSFVPDIHGVQVDYLHAHHSASHIVGPWEMHAHCFHGWRSEIRGVSEKDPFSGTLFTWATLSDGGVSRPRTLD